jgi:hypothetical protein
MEPVNRRGQAGRLRLPVCAAAVACALAGLAVSGPAQSSPQAEDYQVKAAFLLNFTKFIEWPASAFEEANSALSICLLGDDPFNGLLEKLVEGEAVNGHKLVVRSIRQVPKSRSCQVLFINKPEKEIPAILAETGNGVLTVSDREGFLRDGGMIAFVIQSRHVRFDINLRAASRATLSLSARLLNVARLVQK